MRQQFVFRVPLEGHRHAIGLEAALAQFIDELLHQQLGAAAHERHLSFADEYGANGHHLVQKWNRSIVSCA